MARVKLNEPVDVDGKITTIAQLDQEGKIEYEKTKTWSKRAASGERVLYIANIKGTDYWFEISQKAYESRTSKQKNDTMDQAAKEGENTSMVHKYTLATDNNKYYIIDRSRTIEKHSDIIYTYTKEEMQEWSIIDSEGNLIATTKDMKDWNYDDYEILDHDLNEYMVLLEWD